MKVAAALLACTSLIVSGIAAPTSDETVSKFLDDAFDINNDFITLQSNIHDIPPLDSDVQYSHISTVANTYKSLSDHLGAALKRAQDFQGKIPGDRGNDLAHVMTDIEVSVNGTASEYLDRSNVVKAHSELKDPIDRLRSDVDTWYDWMGGHLADPSKGTVADARNKIAQEFQRVVDSIKA